MNVGALSKSFPERHESGRADVVAVLPSFLPAALLNGREFSGPFVSILPRSLPHSLIIQLVVEAEQCSNCAP